MRSIYLTTSGRLAALAAAFVAAMLLVAGLATPGHALAATTGQAWGDYRYTVSGGNVEITGYDGHASALEIPSQIDGRNVTSIGEDAFSGCNWLQSLTIPQGVTSIGYEAFFGCGLTSVSIPQGVTEIGPLAFGYCYSLNSITIPQSVKSIGESAFLCDIALQSVSLPEGLKSIGATAFAHCTSLRSVTVPASVTTIAKDAFQNCAALTIHGNQGSYAQRYAQEQSIPFVAGGGSSAAPTFFHDVASDEWYYEWVAQAAQRQLMNGYKEGSTYTGYFGPEDTVTRAQVATVLWRIAGQPSTSATALWDARGHWAETAIAWCQEKGIITGYTDGQYKGMFRPDADVTREEFATMAYRFAKWAGVNVTGASNSMFNNCADTNLVSWSRDYMVWCAAARVITGKDMGGTYYLAPQENATRAQAAKILVQIAKMAGGEISPYTLDEASGEATGEAVAQSEDAASTTEEATFDEVTFDDVTAAGTQVTADGAGATMTEGAADTTGAGKTGDAGMTGSADSFDVVSPAEPTAGDEGESSSFSEPVTIELAGAAASDLAA